MKSTVLSSLALLGTATALPSLAVKDDPYAAWAPAGDGDVRAPCPMLNTLANHGFLNHNGKNITQDQIVYALGTYLNFNATLSEDLYGIALTTVPTPNATTLDLDDLSRHNILEHDGSLSRLDAYYGNNHIFNEETFDQTKAYFTSDLITLQQAADARLARMYTSNATNPTFNLSETGTLFSFGETAAYVFVFADGANGGNQGAVDATANRTWVEYFFENERLPTSLGWSTRPAPLTVEALLDSTQHVELATGGVFPYPVPSNDSDSSSASTNAKRSEKKRDSTKREVLFHSGMKLSF